MDRRAVHQRSDFVCGPRAHSYSFVVREHTPTGTTSTWFYLATYTPPRTVYLENAVRKDCAALHAHEATWYHPSLLTITILLRPWHASTLVVVLEVPSFTRRRAKASHGPCRRILPYPCAPRELGGTHPTVDSRSILEIRRGDPLSMFAFLEHFGSSYIRMSESRPIATRIADSRAQRCCHTEELYRHAGPRPAST